MNIRNPKYLFFNAPPSTFKGTYKVCGVPKPLESICIDSNDPFNWTKYEIDYFIVMNSKTMEKLPTHFKSKDEALELAIFMNQHTIPKLKPTPLKDRILDALEDIDQSKYDMQNKILKQKEHIKQLETKLRTNKFDVKNSQRKSMEYTQTIDKQEKMIIELENSLEWIRETLITTKIPCIDPRYGYWYNSQIEMILKHMDCAKKDRVRRFYE